MYSADQLEVEGAERWFLTKHGMLMGVWREVTRRTSVTLSTNQQCLRFSCVPPLVFRVVIQMSSKMRNHERRAPPTVAASEERGREAAVMLGAQQTVQ